MKKFIVGAVVLLVAGMVYSAGTLVDTRVANAPPQKITLSWTTTSLGSVVETSDFVRGEMTRVVLVPGTAGWTNVITLKDASGVDLLVGQGAAVVTGTTYSIIPGTLVVSTTGTTNLVSPITVNDKLVLSVTSGGTNNAKTGTVIIYCK